MGKTLSEIAQQLSTPQKVKKTVHKEVEATRAVPKVQLIYAFNGTGKTRLSRDFKQLLESKVHEGVKVKTKLNSPRSPRCRAKKSSIIMPSPRTCSIGITICKKTQNRS